MLYFKILLIIVLAVCGIISWKQLKKMTAEDNTSMRRPYVLKFFTSSMASTFCLLLLSILGDLSIYESESFGKILFRGFAQVWFLILAFVTVSIWFWRKR